MITQNATLAPAYGRDYKSLDTVTVDFLAGKDFKMASLGHGGTYCSIRDFQPGVVVTLRYNKLTKATTVKVP